MRLPSRQGATVILRIPKTSRRHRSTSLSRGSGASSRRAGQQHPFNGVDRNNQGYWHCRPTATPRRTTRDTSQQQRWYFEHERNNSTTHTATEARSSAHCAAESNVVKDGTKYPHRVDRYNDYSVAIGDNGQSIAITGTLYDDSATVGAFSWEFSSPLLWVNDPRYIHPSSGQRIRTLGQYSSNSEIVGARVVSIDGVGVGSEDVFSPPPNLHPVPPRGSLHSRGGIYSYSSDGPRNSAEREDRALVKIEWNDGDESFFDLDWLLHHARNNCLGRRMPDNTKNSVHGNTYDGDRGSTIERPETNATAVTKEIAIGATGNPNSILIGSFDYREIMQDGETLFEGMQELFEHGAVLIRNAPYTEAEIAKQKDRNTTIDEEAPTLSLESVVGDLGRRFAGGKLSHGSLYGDVFHVQVKNDAKNIAYTNQALPPHQDLAYYESKPFLQLLQCVQNNTSNDSSDPAVGGERGESILIDAIAAAEELRQVAPDLFGILCKTEAMFVKERHDADMASPKPHIVVDPTYGQVVEVNWSPPFEGPLQMHPNVAAEDYVRAYQALETILDNNLTGGIDCYGIGGGNSTLLSRSLEISLRNYAKQYTWEYRLEQGDIIVFNNQRMLHGRRAFSAFGTVRRHLIGCYTDAMDTLSRYRLLLRERNEKSGGGFGKRNPGNGSRWI